MTRTAFERQLLAVQEDMLVMAGMVERAIERGVETIKTSNVSLAQQIIEDDLKINRKRYETEDKCLELIATQQPLASDLRTIVSVLHITVDLERMGDHAEGIAKIALMLADEPPVKPYIDIPRMAQVASEMLMGSLESFKDRDPARARAICDHFFFQAEDGIRDVAVTGVQTCALPILTPSTSPTSAMLRSEIQPRS